MIGSLPVSIPGPPSFEVDWRAIEAEPLFRALHGVRQDPSHHAEGDVAIHTRMVIEALLALPAYRALGDEGRAAVFLGALLHDVGKPARTRIEDDGRITSRGHSAHGALLARRWLYEHDVRPALREHVCALVKWHQVPFFLIDRDDAQRLGITVSMGARSDWLALVAEADARGRTSATRQRIIDACELFREHQRELGALEGPYAFASDHARAMFFRDRDRRVPYDAYDDTWGEAVVLSGLPASGKDTWARAHAGGLPVISLDGIREELRIHPDDDQARVRVTSMERLREHLRARRPVVWNATNVDHERRAPILAECFAYGARVKLVHVEAPLAVRIARNRARARPVPDRVMDAMLDRWDPPDATEGHEVVHIGR